MNSKECTLKLIISYNDKSFEEISEDIISLQKVKDLCVQNFGLLQEDKNDIKLQYYSKHENKFYSIENEEEIIRMSEEDDSGNLFININALIDKKEDKDNSKENKLSDKNEQEKLLNKKDNFNKENSKLLNEIISESTKLDNKENKEKITNLISQDIKLDNKDKNNLKETNNVGDEKNSDIISNKNINEQKINSSEIFENKAKPLLDTNIDFDKNQYLTGIFEKTSNINEKLEIENLKEEIKNNKSIYDLEIDRLQNEKKEQEKENNTLIVEKKVLLLKIQNLKKENEMIKLQKDNILKKYQNLINGDDEQNNQKSKISLGDKENVEEYLNMEKCNLTQIKFNNKICNLQKTKNSEIEIISQKNRKGEIQSNHENELIKKIIEQMKKCQNNEIIEKNKELEEENKKIKNLLYKEVMEGKKIFESKFILLKNMIEEVRKNNFDSNKEINSKNDNDNKEKNQIISEKENNKISKPLKEEMIEEKKNCKIAVSIEENMNTPKKIELKKEDNNSEFDNTNNEYKKYEALNTQNKNNEQINQKNNNSKYKVNNINIKEGKNKKDDNEKNINLFENLKDNFSNNDSSKNDNKDNIKNEVNNQFINLNNNNIDINSKVYNRKEQYKILLEQFKIFLGEKIKNVSEKNILDILLKVKEIILLVQLN